MEFKESFDWLEKKNYLDMAKSKVKLFSKILKQTINPENEDVLILGDTGFENHRISTKLSSYYFFAAENLNLNSKILLQNPKARGEPANPEVINALGHHKTQNIIIANLSNKFGEMKALGKSFRKYCNNQNHRFISTTSLGMIPNELEDTFINALDIDYKELAKKHAKLKEILDEGERIRITTEAGTDLNIGIKDMTSISADGLYRLPGQGGNLPSGEVYIPPDKKDVNGKVIIDGSYRTVERSKLVEKPFSMKINDGEITKIEGDGPGAQGIIDSLKWAKKNAKHPWGIKRIGELGIGLNPNAKLIGSTIMDEKVLNTAHVAIGSNHWMGGTIYAIIHLDQVFKDPIIEVDGTEIKVDIL